MQLLLLLAATLASDTGQCGAANPEAPSRLVAELEREYRNATKGSRARKIRALVADRVDWGYVAAESLGKAYSSLTEAQRRRFEATFRKLMQTYTAKHAKKSKPFTLDIEKVTWAEEFAGVRTKLAVEGHNPVLIVITYRSVAGRCRVVDVTTEGDSLLRLYEEQFTGLLREKGFAGLIARMNKRIAEL